MRVGVLGTGMVGRALSTKLASLGHEVRMGSRQDGNPAAVEWAAGAGSAASEGAFADAAGFADLVVNATSGSASIEALTAAGESNLAGKVLIDVANPIAPGSGMPPSLSVCNTESLGEQIQARFPEARVVKTLNTVNANVMVSPASVRGPHNVFVSGNDAAAKAEVTELLESFGWPRADVIDLGDITTARGTEMYLALWLRLMIAQGTPAFNIHVVRAAG